MVNKYVKFAATLAILDPAIDGGDDWDLLIVPEAMTMPAFSLEDNNPKYGLIERIINYFRRG